MQLQDLDNAEAWNILRETQDSKIKPALLLTAKLVPRNVLTILASPLPNSRPPKAEGMMGSVVRNSTIVLATQNQNLTSALEDTGTLFAIDLMQAIIILQLSIQIHTTLETNNNWPAWALETLWYDGSHPSRKSKKHNSRRHLHLKICNINVMTSFNQTPSINLREFKHLMTK